MRAYLEAGEREKEGRGKGKKSKGWETTRNNSLVTALPNVSDSLIAGLFCQIFTGGGSEFRLAMTDYSGHGGCQIGKRRIVVRKYTGLARNGIGGRGLLWG